MSRLLLVWSVAFLYSGLTPAARAQAPGTDIFLVAVSHDGDRLTFGPALNVTNRTGYDNQPSFTPDAQAFLYTVIGPDGQAEAFQYDIASGQTLRLTHTSESEYSPIVLPNGGGFSVIRVEADSAQRLWQFARDGSDPSLLIPDVAPAGYHAWIDEERVALFVLGSPATLHLVDTHTGTDRTIASDIGRSLFKIPGREAISFLHRQDGAAWISAFDLSTEQIDRLAPGFEENEFYTWTPDGIILAARGTALFAWTPEESTEWKELHDFRSDVSGAISRIAVSPDGRWLALVATDAPD